MCVVPTMAITTDVLLETQDPAQATGFIDVLHRLVERASLTRLIGQYPTVAV